MGSIAIENKCSDFEKEGYCYDFQFYIIVAKTTYFCSVTYYIYKRNIVA